jgi:magnesium-transporting ATPase (P-type)
MVKIPLEGCWDMVVEHPFDSTVKRMSTVRRSKSSYLLFGLGLTVDRLIFPGLEVRRPIRHLAREERRSRLHEGSSVRCLTSRSRFLPRHLMLTLHFLRSFSERVLDRCTMIGLDGESQGELNASRKSEIIARMDLVRLLILTCVSFPFSDFLS